MTFVGWSEVNPRQGEVPTKQCVADVNRRRAAVDGVGWIQRRRPLLRQHRLLARRTQHQHLRRHQPPRLDLPRRHLLQEAFGHWRRSGHDHRPRLHHPWGRYKNISS